MSRWYLRHSRRVGRVIRLALLPGQASPIRSQVRFFSLLTRPLSTLTRVHIFRCSDAAREDRPFLRPSARSELEICRESNLVL